MTVNTLTDVRQAMGTALEAIPGLQVSSYVLSNPTPPVAQISRGPVRYDLAMHGGLNEWSMMVRIYIAEATDIGAQMLLDSYLAPDGDFSVRAALEADVTLGGLVQAVHVNDATGEQEYARATGGPLIGSEWTVAVWL